MHEMYAQNSKTNEKPYSSDIAIVRYAGKDEEPKKQSSVGFMRTQTSFRMKTPLKKDTEEIKVLSQKQLQEMFAHMNKRTMP